MPNTMMTFGAKVSVCSWICVVAWKIEMIRRTTRLITIGGAEAMITNSSASWVMKVSWCMAGRKASQVADHEPLRDQVPPVDEDEEQELEGHRDGGGGEH